MSDGLSGGRQEQEKQEEGEEAAAEEQEEESKKTAKVKQPSIPLCLMQGVAATADSGDKGER